MIQLKPIRLSKCSQLTESWVQDQIANDPTILGLGDLILKDKERPQPSAGRLDLLLQEPETLKRYEVELQLGAIDESHLIRCIEYWDIEKKRYPQYEHAAVIIAEEITSRFLNVIHLFNGHIPLIALKMTAYAVGDDFALTFVKVLDELSFGLVDADEPVSDPVDRSFWETKYGTAKTMALLDSLFQIVKEVEPSSELNYNKHYIGLKVNGNPMNFVTFLPRRGHVIMTIKLPQNQEIEDEISEIGIDTLKYEADYRQHRLRIPDALDAQQNDVVRSLCQRSREWFGK